MQSQRRGAFLNTEVISEKDYCISKWKANFADKTDNKIAIYGVGNNTKAVLESFLSENIVGLMDESRTGSIIFGKPVINVEEAVSCGVDFIVIIARTGNVRIIYRRIAEVCNKNSIPVYDISGNRLDSEETEAKSFSNYTDITEEEAKGKIDKADVISFDIFDTLLMRRVLYPRDVFALVGERLGLGEEFVKQRIETEMSLYAEGKQPTIYEIYERLEGVSPNTELELESQYLVKRESIVTLLNYAQKSGKDVYLVSDMYLPCGIIKELLNNSGINIPIENILVSCDYGVSKSNGLFEILRNKVGEKKILHIGDNYEADIQYAVRFGIDDTFKIESVLAMLEESYASNILKYDTALPNRRLIGEFIAKELNDPFLFSTTKGKVKIGSGYALGYSYIAPFILGLFAWILKKAKELALDFVLLAARDGFILEKIFDLYNRKYDGPPMKYFYTSRKAAVLAGIRNEEDILCATRLPFSGSPIEMLVKRFGLKMSEVKPMVGTEVTAQFILRHSDTIFYKAEKVRTGYKKYIKSLHISSNSRVGFYDFVSAGTCQKALMNICDFELYGLYCASLDNGLGYKTDARVESMFGLLDTYKPKFKFMNDYFFLESVLMSDKPTLSMFNESGEPEFLPESRSNQWLCQLAEIQRGILDYARNVDFEIFMSNKMNIELLDELYNCMSPEFCVGGDAIRNLTTYTDEFCMR